MAVFKRKNRVAKKGKQGMSINATPQARGSLER